MCSKLNLLRDLTYKYSLYLMLRLSTGCSGNTKEGVGGSPWGPGKASKMRHHLPRFQKIQLMSGRTLRRWIRGSSMVSRGSESSPLPPLNLWLKTQNLSLDFRMLRSCLLWSHKLLWSKGCHLSTPQLQHESSVRVEYFTDERESFG